MCFQGNFLLYTQPRLNYFYVLLEREKIMRLTNNNLISDICKLTLTLFYITLIYFAVILHPN